MAEPEVKPQVMPWQEKWEEKPVQSVSSMATAVMEGATSAVEQLKSGKMPWELSWKPKAVAAPAKAAPEAIAVTPTPSTPSGNSVSQFLTVLTKVESNNDPNAKNPRSTATGLGQFTEGTWMDAVKAAGKNYTLEDRTDPQKSMEVLKVFTEKNKERAVKDLGRNPSPTELYIYHLLGRNGAGGFLKASEDALAVDYVSAKAAINNKNIFYNKGQPVTVGDVLNRFRGKFEPETKKGK